MLTTEEQSRILDTEMYPDLNTLLGRIRVFDGIYSEIGFGPDRFFMDLAEKERNNLYIGIEIKGKRVKKADSKIQKMNLDNALIIWGEAKETICRFFSNESLNGVYINFPDPYHKKRHFKRRLITLDFLDILYRKLKDQGFFIIITDNEPYMEHIYLTYAEFARQHRAGLEAHTGKGLPAGYPLTEFAVRESKGKGIIQYLHAVKH